MSTARRRTHLALTPLRVHGRLNEGFSTSTAASAVSNVLQTGNMPALETHVWTAFRQRLVFVPDNMCQFGVLLLARAAVRCNEGMLRIALDADKLALL